MVAIHQELNRLTDSGHSNWISHVHRRGSLLGESWDHQLRVAVGVCSCSTCFISIGAIKEETYSKEEMSYVKQGEEALQRAIVILSDQEGWTVETVAVSTHTQP